MIEPRQPKDVKEPVGQELMPMEELQELLKAFEKSMGETEEFAQQFQLNRVKSFIDDLYTKVTKREISDEAPLSDQ